MDTPPTPRSTSLARRSKSSLSVGAYPPEIQRTTICAAFRRVSSDARVSSTHARASPSSAPGPGVAGPTGSCTAGWRAPQAARRSATTTVATTLAGRGRRGGPVPGPRPDPGAFARGPSPDDARAGRRDGPLLIPAPL